MGPNQVLMNSDRLSAVVINNAKKVLVKAIDADVSQVGQKAIGLTKIPKTWVPKWLSVPLATCNFALSGKIQWLDIAGNLPTASREIEIVGAKIV
jgi:hypothetical protein